MDDLDLNQTVTLYDPHDGRRCCDMPIPAAVLRAAQQLDGQTLTLKEAVARIQAQAPAGQVYPIPKHGYICLHVGDYRQGQPEHLFAVIHYR
jgi:hypothetical protein